MRMASWMMTAMSAGSMTGISSRHSRGMMRRPAVDAMQRKTPPPKGRRNGSMRFVLIVLLLAGCASPSPATHIIEGAMALTDSDGWYPAQLGDPCTGQGGYADMTEGAQVVVRDGAGETLAVGNLEAGRLLKWNQCAFAFTIEGIPTADFYRIEVAHRGELTYPAIDLAYREWQVVFTLGD